MRARVALADHTGDGLGNAGPSAVQEVPGPFAQCVAEKPLEQLRSVDAPGEGMTIDPAQQDE